MIRWLILQVHGKFSYWNLEIHGEILFGRGKKHEKANKKESINWTNEIILIVTTEIF